ncbi:MAG TPA: aminomethyl-transferring glycine dehydrogenase subunit GcvPA [Chthonomonadales bacterium]|nr:aminomethyl-transferring glycine dehydrogenase subunit GcvPA [Chthonomonadales bacterium]
MGFIPHTDRERAEMLAAIGVDSIDDLFEPIPEPLRMARPLALPAALDERALLRHLERLASDNVTMDTHACFLGAGVYDHFVPAVVDALISRGEFLTSYTPYQPEMSQGMLQAIYEFQSLVATLTGMEIANASMYDAATAMAEACLMACEVKGSRVIGVSRLVHPHYRHVLRTYAESSGVEVRELAHAEGATQMPDGGAPLAAVVVQNPNFLGCIEDLSAAREASLASGSMLIVVADPIALALLRPPGDYGADVVVGEGQGLGCSPGFGGPMLGFFATRRELARRMPGRIVGATTDLDGRRAYTMTLRTREQDIRREKATSNICTNEALLALAASVHLAVLGPQGLREVAAACLRNAHSMVDALTQVGARRAFERPFFREVAVRPPGRLGVAELNRRLLQRGFLGGYDLGSAYDELDGCWLVCATENRTREEIDGLAQAVAELTR